MNFYRSIFLRRNLFFAVGIIICLFIIGSFYTVFISLAQISLLILTISFVAEIYVLYAKNQGMDGQRNVKDRLSNGDENSIYIVIQNNYRFKINTTLIDELPQQFQVRDKSFDVAISAGESKTIKYKIKPTERGTYTFGNLNIFATTVLGLVQRRFAIDAEQKVAVYPSYQQVKKYAFMAISNTLQNEGIKKIRKRGHNYEFDQIKEYARGDDYRAINWKATAKKNTLMVNQYQEEKSQNVVAVINKGRVMQMPFEEMTLLDHSINSALVMLNIACQKHDYAGLITFNKDLETILPPSPNRRQMAHVLDSLFKQETDFTESNYEKLFVQIRHTLKRRSLIFLYTNFESMSGLQRALPYLKGIAKYHRLIVVFFKNTELNQLTQSKSESLEDVYIKTIATKFKIEKQLIVRELHKNGIDAVLTSPSQLTVNSINKYLEIKSHLLM